jgi:hypothetical protein
LREVWLLLRLVRSSKGRLLSLLKARELLGLWLAAERVELGLLTLATELVKLLLLLELLVLELLWELLLLELGLRKLLLLLWHTVAGHKRLVFWLPESSKGWLSRLLCLGVQLDVVQGRILVVG